MEDAVSVAACLPLGTKPEEVPERLELYEKCRADRAWKVQEHTRVAGRDQVENEDPTKSVKLNSTHHKLKTRQNTY
jgi:2-polyprenyl-6-methoxyphenol hydroxylase-like FAD-dependent oxidoreductase